MNIYYDVEDNCYRTYPDGDIATIDQMRELIENKNLSIIKLQQENRILKENAENNDKVVDKVNWDNMLLKKENQELKQKYENAVTDYETTMAEKEQLKKQLKDKMEDYRRMKDNFDSKVDVLTKIETQQKEFIDYLEDESKEVYRDGGLRQNILRQILQKYKEITRGK